jgi:hypothetical protein
MACGASSHLQFWKELSRAIRFAIRTGQPSQATPSPIVAAFADGNLTLTLPSGRSITYPQARLVPGKYEDGDPDIQFRDNACGQWKLYRGWFGTFVENVVQAVARDLLAAAIDRCEARGLNVVFHCHDEVTVEVPIATLSDTEFLAILREPPSWADGLPLNGKVHSGLHYLEAPKEPATPLLTRESEDAVLEQAIDDFIEETCDDIGPIDDPTQVEREDDEDFVANLPDDYAPLTDLISVPLSSDNKVNCPFHVDEEPSCTIYPDHFHCYGCGEHGDRLDWLMRADGMTEAEAISHIKDWPGPSTKVPRNGSDNAGDFGFIKAIWRSAQPLLGSMGERYLDETRGIDITKLPSAIHDNLRFHPHCVSAPARICRA